MGDRQPVSLLVHVADGVRRAGAFADQRPHAVAARAVVDDDDLEARVVEREQRVEGRAERALAVARGDDDAGRRRARQEPGMLAPAARRLAVARRRAVRAQVRLDALVQGCGGPRREPGAVGVAAQRQLDDADELAVHPHRHRRARVGPPVRREHRDGRRRRVGLDVEQADRAALSHRP